MPQSPISFNAKNSLNKLVALLVDAAGLLLTTSGGSSSSLNVSAAAVLKAAPGRLCKIVVITPGTGGALTINDANGGSVAAAAANEIVSIPFGSLVAGEVITLDWPCTNGIDVSAVTTGGGAFSFSWA